MRYLITYIVKDDSGAMKLISSCITDMVDSQKEALDSFVNSYPLESGEVLRVLSIVGIEFGSEKKSWEVDDSFERRGYDSED